MMRHSWAVLAGAAIVIGQAVPAFAEPPAVVVTIKPVHSLVAGVMHGIAMPTLLVEGTASPHSFALKPSQSRVLQGAGLFVRVSPAVEPFTERLVSALPGSVTVVTLQDAPGMRLLARRTGATFEPAPAANAAARRDNDHADNHGPDHDHEDGHDHAHGASDGHLWLDPANAKVIVAHVAAVLAERDGDNAARYAANAAAVLARIDRLASDIDAELAPVRGTPFAVFHDAYQYFERRFGLAAVGAITQSPDASASAKRLTVIRRAIARLGAVCVFGEPHLASKVLDSVTEGSGVRSAVLDPEGTAMQPGPDLYFTLMRGLAASMRGCLIGRQ